MHLTSRHESSGRPEAAIVPVDGLHDPTDPSRIQRTVYEVRQHFRYCYTAPIRDLRQRLVVVPRPVHGDQRVLRHSLQVSQPHSREPIRNDAFGNVIYQVSIPKVAEVVDFDVSLTIERLTGREYLQAPEVLDQLALAVEDDEGAFAARGALQILGYQIEQGGGLARAGASDDPVVRSA